MVSLSHLKKPALIQAKNTAPEKTTFIWRYPSVKIKTKQKLIKRLSIFFLINTFQFCNPCSKGELKWLSFSKHIYFLLSDILNDLYIACFMFWTQFNKTFSLFLKTLLLSHTPTYPQTDPHTHTHTHTDTLHGHGQQNCCKIYSSDSWNCSIKLWEYIHWESMFYVFFTACFPSAVRRKKKHYFGQTLPVASLGSKYCFSFIDTNTRWWVVNYTDAAGNRDINKLG